jgi:hypothetical protein
MERTGTIWPAANSGVVAGMTPELLVFFLRLISAVLLLTFLGVVAWLIYQDVRLTAALLSDRQRHHGYLRLLTSSSPLLKPGSRFLLLPITSIGRAASNNVVIDDHYASAEHALVTLRGRQWWLEDMGSRNGTLLNEMPLEGATVVSSGDVITIGDARLKIELS